MVAWIFSLGQFFDSFGTASRLPFVIISQLTIWIWCNHLAKSLQESEKLTFLIILSLHPLIGLGGFVANPDVPFLFFWTLSMLGFLWAIDKPEVKKYPIYLGVFLGLAFCSKYLIAFILPAIFIFLILNKKFKEVPAFNIFLTTLMGFIFSLPVLVWNYQNDWASLSFQINHGLGQNQWNPRWTVEFMAGTAVLLFPPFLYLYFKNKTWKSTNFHNVTFLSLTSIFVFTTLKGDTELNWPIIIYPSFFLLIAPKITFYSKSFLSFVLIYGLLTITLIGGASGLWGENLHGRLVEAKKYEKIFEQSKSYQPLYLSTYQTASYFWYLSKSPYYKLVGSSRIDFYDSLKESNPLVEKFYFLKEQYQLIPEAIQTKYDFAKILDIDHGFEIYEASIKK